MDQPIEKALDDCVYFSVKKIDRYMNKIAEEAFRKTGLAPTYGFIILILEQKDNISQKEIAEMLHIAPSTVARFIEKLVSKGLVKVISQGRKSLVSLTEQGREFSVEVDEGWENLHVACDSLLGHAESVTLNQEINATTNRIIEKL